MQMQGPHSIWGPSFFLVLATFFSYNNWHATWGPALSVVGKQGACKVASAACQAPAGLRCAVAHQDVGGRGSCGNALGNSVLAMFLPMREQLCMGMDGHCSGMC